MNVTPEREAEIRRDFATDRPLLHVACGDTVRELLSEIDRLRDYRSSAQLINGLGSTPPRCQIHDEPMVLTFYQRGPNDPMGNGWRCLKCRDERMRTL